MFALLLPRGVFSICVLCHCRSFFFFSSRCNSGHHHFCAHCLRSIAETQKKCPGRTVYTIGRPAISQLAFCSCRGRAKFSRTGSACLLARAALPLFGASHCSLFLFLQEKNVILCL
uniref:Putative secreted protein n=1 Tax=Amblyomma americanum TaxID=6943 RepID=A0A0C9R4G1_AMBAM